MRYFRKYDFTKMIILFFASQSPKQLSLTGFVFIIKSAAGNVNINDVNIF